MTQGSFIDVLRLVHAGSRPPAAEGSCGRGLLRHTGTRYQELGRRSRIPLPASHTGLSHWLTLAYRPPTLPHTGLSTSHT